MPYHIEREGNKFKVVVDATGKVVGTHPSKVQAQAQLGALYANVPDAHIKKERGTIAGDSSANSGRISGGVGWKIEFNTPDCQHGWSVIKVGSGQSIGCFFKEEDAKAALEALAVTEPVVKCMTCGCDMLGVDHVCIDSDVKKDDVSGQTKQNEQEGIGSLNFWNGSFAPVIGGQASGGWMSTYNSPTQHDGKQSVGFGNHSDPHGRSNQ